MGGKITSRFPQDTDIVELAENMRQGDIDELAAVTDLKPCEAVIASVQASDAQFLRAWHVDGRLICIGGCSPVSVNTAAPWLLATDLLDAHVKSLHKLAAIEVIKMLAVYPLLRNVVDARQVKVIAWLERLGFEVTDAEPVKIGFGLKRFSMMRCADV